MQVISLPLNRIEEIIENKKDEYLEQLFTLLRQKSISTQNDGISECADFT